MVKQYKLHYKVKCWLVAAGNVNSMQRWLILREVLCSAFMMKIQNLKVKCSKSKLHWVWSQLVRFVSARWDESSLSFTVTWPNMLDVAGQLSVGQVRKFPVDCFGLFSGFDYMLWACFMDIFIFGERPVHVFHIFINHLKCVSCTWAIWICKEFVSNISWHGYSRHCGTITDPNCLNWEHLSCKSLQVA